MAGRSMPVAGCEGRRRTAAEQALDAGRRALVRAGDVVQKAETRATDAAVALTKASEEHANALAAAAAADIAPPPNPKRQAREVEADAQDELAAAQAAHATVKARLGNLEDESRAAAAMVTVAADMVVRSHASEVLMEAEALAARLRGLRCILCFMESPEVSASDTLSTPRRDPLSEDWQFALRQYGRTEPTDARETTGKSSVRETRGSPRPRPRCRSF